MVFLSVHFFWLCSVMVVGPKPSYPSSPCVPDATIFLTVQIQKGIVVTGSLINWATTYIEEISTLPHSSEWQWPLCCRLLPIFSWVM